MAWRGCSVPTGLLTTWHILSSSAGLSPPLKATDVSASLFAAFDSDADGDVAVAEAGYLLAMLTSGSVRERVEATLDAPVPDMEQTALPALMSPNEPERAFHTQLMSS